MQTLTAKPGKPAITKAGGYVDTRIDVLDKCFAAKVFSGDTAFNNVRIAGIKGKGLGPHIEGGKSFTWRGGGCDSSLDQYSAGYLGNIRPSKEFPKGTRLEYALLENLDFRFASLGDSLLRVMGCDKLVIRRCKFDELGNTHFKQALQLRHVRDVLIEDCDVDGGFMWGVLKQKDCKDPTEAAAYLADAQKYRIQARLVSCRIGGNFDVRGQADVVAEFCTFTKPDSRGPRSTCVMLEAFPNIKAPTCQLLGCSFGKWQKPAGKGVIVK